MGKNIATAQRLYDALKRITAYQSPEKLRRNSEKQYGLEAGEAIEYAYENVLAEAARAIKGVRRPAEPTRSQKFAAAGFTRRPSAKSLPSDE